MTPGDVAEGLGWGPILSMTTTLALGLLSYGASLQRNKQTETTVEALKVEHGAAIKEAKAAADQIGKELIAYEKAARDKFVLTSDLERVERSLSGQIAAGKDETKQKIEELKNEFGKKGIEHVVRNAITAGMAQVLHETRKGGER